MRVEICINLAVPASVGNADYILTTHLDMPAVPGRGDSIIMPGLGDWLECKFCIWRLTDNGWTPEVQVDNGLYQSVAALEEDLRKFISAGWQLQ